MGEKRGQFTLFLIIALILLIGSAITLYIVQRKSIDPVEAAITSGGARVDPSTFKQNVENCVRDRALRFAELLAFRGGSFKEIVFNPFVPTISTGVVYYNSAYRYLCKNEDGKGCVNLLLTRKDMETELNTKIREHVLKQCIDFSGFVSAGYEVETGDLGIDSKIAVEVVNIRIIYPTLIKKGQTLLNIPEYFTKIEIPLGRLYDLAVLITNEEIVKGTFDKDLWMQKHGADIRIKKHRPYPDIVYKLIEDVPQENRQYEFNFALQGENTVSKLNSKLPPAPYKFCDMKDEKNCYANTEEFVCINKGGSYTLNPQFCDTSTTFGSAACPGGQCDDCARYNKKHGDTWCVYDSLVGDGTDRVGTRHYQQSCIDGKIYNEECRDFREELCTTGSDRRSVCRPNRWEDCAFQTAQDGCEDKNKRDCYWADWLGLNEGQGTAYQRQKAIRSLCFPQVPPGFRFYSPSDFNQIDSVCQMANELTTFRQPVFKTIGDIRPPKSWVYAAAVYCGAMGDCGNKRNILGFNVRGRYFNSDFWYPPNTEEPAKVYGPATIDYRDFLSLPNDRFHKIFGIVYNPHPTGSEANQAVRDFHSVASGWDMCKKKRVCKCKSRAFDCKFYGPCSFCYPDTPVPSHFRYYFTGYAACYPWFPESYTSVTLPPGSINFGYGYYNTNTGMIHRYDGSVYRAPTPAEQSFVNTILQTAAQAQQHGAQPLQSQTFTYGVPDSCGHCNNDPLKPCTEYKCRSLGKNCRYNLNLTTGIGVCSDDTQAIIMRGPLRVAFNKTTLPFGFHAVDTDFLGKNTYDLRPEIQPDQDFEFEISTNREANCQASLLPNQDVNGKFAGLGSVGACGGNRQCIEIVDEGTRHKVRFRLRSDEAFRERLLELLNFTTLLQATMPGSGDLQFEGFSIPSGAVEDFIRQATGIPADEVADAITEMLIAAESRRNIVFLRCIDDVGSQDIDNIGVSFIINITDIHPPEVEIQTAQALLDTGIYADPADSMNNITFSFIVDDDQESVNCIYTLSSGGVEQETSSSYVATGQPEQEEMYDLAPGDYALDVTCSDGVNKDTATEAVTV